MVLTAASCTGVQFANESSTAVTPGTIIAFVTTLSSRSNSVKNVTEKYIHPEWNSKTFVGNLALLKVATSWVDVHFKDRPLMSNDFKDLPKTLDFKGFGKTLPDGKSAITKAQTTHELDDAESKRTLSVSFKEGICPGVNAEGKIEKDVNWWSFLCTDAADVRTAPNNALCEDDVGGPLFNLMVSGNVRLYGVFSHAYNSLHPFCEKLCYNQRSNAPFPCNTDPVSMYYKHTVMVDRYTDWVLRMLEWAKRTSTHAPVRLCPKTEKPTTYEPLNPYYDEDMYSDRRVMIINTKKCHKIGGVDLTVSHATAATTVTAAAVLAAAVSAVVLAA